MVSNNRDQGVYSIFLGELGALALANERYNNLN